MWLSIYNSNKTIKSNQFLSVAIVLADGNENAQTETLRDTNKESPTFGNLIVPEGVTQYKLSNVAYKQYQKLGYDINDLAYVEWDTADGPEKEHTYWSYDSSSISDKRTVESVKNICTELLTEAEAKIQQADIKGKNSEKKTWEDYHKVVWVIHQDPLGNIGEDYPTVPFFLDFGTTGKKVERV